MRKNKSLSKNKVVIIALCLLLVGLVVFGLEKMNVINVIPNGPALTAEEQEDKKINDAAKKKFIEDTEASSSNDVDTSSEALVADSVELTAKQETNGSVTVLTKLFGFSDGKCSLAVSNAGKTFTQSADIIYQPEFSSCAGFSVPIGSLGSGSWSIQVTAINSAGSPSSKTTTLEVK